MGAMRTNRELMSHDIDCLRESIREVNDGVRELRGTVQQHQIEIDGLTTIVRDGFKEVASNLTIMSQNIVGLQESGHILMTATQNLLATANNHERRILKVESRG